MLCIFLMQLQIQVSFLSIHLCFIQFSLFIPSAPYQFFIKLLWYLVYTIHLLTTASQDVPNLFRLVDRLWAGLMCEHILRSLRQWVLHNVEFMILSPSLYQLTIYSWNIIIVPSFHLWVFAYRSIHLLNVFLVNIAYSLRTRSYTALFCFWTSQEADAHWLSLSPHVEPSICFDSCINVLLLC